MSGVEKSEFGVAPITCHSFNAERSGLAISQNDSTVKIFKKVGKKWEDEHTLSEHGQRVTGIDWAPKSNRIVTCAADRNAFVWNLEGNKWQQVLVIPRINRAATCVKWSPNEDKFAVGSGSRLIAICYFDKANNWWGSKHIKKPIRSTITCLDWHPNNILLGCGSTDFKCRVFSAYIKELEPKPEANSWGKKMMFGALMAEFSSGGGGWVHSVAFSPSGHQIAWVGHDSSVAIADSDKGNELFVVKENFLPFMTITWISAASLVAAGYDCNPMVFNYDGTKLSFSAKLDQPKKNDDNETISAMERFKSLDKRATTGGASKGSVMANQHQNTITQVSVHTGSRESVSKLATTGVDGALVLWDIQTLEKSIEGLRIS